MTSLPIPIMIESDLLVRQRLLVLAKQLAPNEGYNLTELPGLRILRTEMVLHDVPVLYKPGAVFVLQGRKQGVLKGDVYLYDEDHYLSVSVPVPFRMESVASADRPLLAIYMDFDMQLAAEIALEIEKQPSGTSAVQAKSLISSRMGSDILDVLLRLLQALTNPVETAVLGKGILRELHYRVLVGPQGGAMISALQQRGTPGKIVQSIAQLRENYRSDVSVTALASDAGMSVPSYHAHFKALIGSSPMQYVKAMRLHEARLMLARQDRTIAEVALSIGYVSPSQFSRDFKRHFRRTASEEVKWVRQHLGALAIGV